MILNNGFTYPKNPVILHSNPQIIEHLNWGLIPSWAKNEEIRKYTLNAKIETLREKPSFKQVVSNRALILADGFYDRHWADAQGKQKQSYLITLEGFLIYVRTKVVSSIFHTAKRCAQKNAIYYQNLQFLIVLII